MISARVAKIALAALLAALPALAVFDIRFIADHGLTALGVR